MAALDKTNKIDREDSMRRSDSEIAFDQLWLKNTDAIQQFNRRPTAPVQDKMKVNLADRKTNMATVEKSPLQNAVDDSLNDTLKP